MALPNGKPLDQHREARRCADPDCTTKLSRYNPNEWCSAHGGWHDPNDRRNRDIL